MSYYEAKAKYNRDEYNINEVNKLYNIINDEKIAKYPEDTDFKISYDGINEYELENILRYKSKEINEILDYCGKAKITCEQINFNEKNNYEELTKKEISVVKNLYDNIYRKIQNINIYRKIQNINISDEDKIKETINSVQIIYEIIAKYKRYFVKYIDNILTNLKSILRKLMLLPIYKSNPDIKSEIDNLNTVINSTLTDEEEANDNYTISYSDYSEDYFKNGSVKFYDYSTKRIRNEGFEKNHIYLQFLNSITDFTDSENSLISRVISEMRNNTGYNIYLFDGIIKEIDNINIDNLVDNYNGKEAQKFDIIKGDNGSKLKDILFNRTDKKYLSSVLLKPTGSEDEANIISSEKFVFIKFVECVMPHILCIIDHKNINYDFDDKYLNYTVVYYATTDIKMPEHGMNPDLSINENENRELIYFGTIIEENYKVIQELINDKEEDFSIDIKKKMDKYSKGNDETELDINKIMPYFHILMEMLLIGEYIQERGKILEHINFIIDKHCTTDCLFVSLGDPKGVIFEKLISAYNCLFNQYKGRKPDEFISSNKLNEDD